MSPRAQALLEEIQREAEARRLGVPLPPAAAAPGVEQGELLRLVDAIGAEVAQLTLRLGALGEAIEDVAGRLAADPARLLVAEPVAAEPSAAVVALPPPERPVPPRGPNLTLLE